jgi:hypothetical protein
MYYHSLRVYIYPSLACHFPAYVSLSTIICKIIIKWQLKIRCIFVYHDDTLLSTILELTDTECCTVWVVVHLGIHVLHIPGVTSIVPPCSSMGLCTIPIMPVVIIHVISWELHASMVYQWISCTFQLRIIM